MKKEKRKKRKKDTRNARKHDTAVREDYNPVSRQKLRDERYEKKKTEEIE